MPRLSIRRSIVAIVCLAQLTIACTAAGPDASIAGSTASAAASRTPAAASPTPAAASPTHAAASPTPGVSLPATSAEPPAATLAAEGGDPVAGQLGSFTWNDGGSDSPWLPGAPVEVGAGEPLTVRVADGVAVSEWSARRVPAGTANGSGALGLGGGPAPITFNAPGPGSWSVQVLVRFPDGLGSAAYYWQLTVR